MDRRLDTRGLRRLAATTLLLSALAASVARAGDPLGLYVGAAAGRARVEANAPYLGDFSQDHSAFKVVLGFKPIPLFGGELEYVDFGHPHEVAAVPNTGFAVAGDVTMKGAAAFGMLYLPVPVVDVFAKAGLARLDTHANGGIQCVTTCPPIGAVPFFPPVSRTDTELAAGVGVGFKLGAFGVRGEYELFSAADHHPYLWSLGATWAF